MMGENSTGFTDTFGNVWEWVEDDFNGFADETSKFYDDYSSPTYDGKHTLMMVSHLVL